MKKVKLAEFGNPFSQEIDLCSVGLMAMTLDLLVTSEKQHMQKHKADGFELTPATKARIVKRIKLVKAARSLLSQAVRL